jgi:riboflavin kinase/FMN adenylyltransferase
MANANNWLGAPYLLTGPVVHGDALGRELGFPTANLSIEEHKLVPADGVYAARTNVNGKHYLAGLSIGSKPTISEEGKRTIEAVLIDFEGDLYGQTLSLECLRYLRPQEKYPTLDALKAAIANDVFVIKSLDLSL